MEKRIFDAALAGLVHDVGKVVQRAMEDPWRFPEDTREEGQPVHAAWALDFIEKKLPPKYRIAARFGAYHHRPDRCPAEDRSIAELISLADKLSAGERADPDEERKEKDPPKQLASIFDRVSLTHASPPNQIKNLLPLSPLELGEANIFSGLAVSGRDSRAAYLKLQEGLEAAARQDTPDNETYLENLLFAFQRYTWCVPSAFYYSIPDVSLYDHARMTAALAVCMADWPPEEVSALLSSAVNEFQKAKSEQTSSLNQPVALLVGGDISGIQKFIYSISSSHAAKSLRGRSFYLQLLTEAVLRFVLKELGIPYTNVIYSGGGHFFLLVPISSQSKLPDIQREVSKKLLRCHGVELYLAMGFIPVPANGFRKGAFPEYWQKMHANLNLAKQRRYAELKEDFYESVFQPQPHGGNNEDTCSVCGQERPGTKLIDEEDRICSMCQSFDQAIGKELPGAPYVTLFLGEPLEGASAGTALDALATFGMEVSFKRKDPKPVILQNPKRAICWTLEDMPVCASGDLPTSVMLRYTVNQVPPRTFDKLQDEGKGIARLGVLRMDVDNLGLVFKQGFGRTPLTSIATVARLSSLSFQISLFFEGWVKKICAEQPDLVYTVYAGGDDLFLVAPWHIVPELACRITRDFSRYTGGNSDLHISGGMSFIHGKYPIYQAAEDAKEALDKAKQEPGKNAFTFLDQAWTWEKFDRLAIVHKRLLEIEEAGGPRQLLQVLQRLADQAASKQKAFGGRLMWGPWMWMGDYQLTRMAEQQKKQSKPELAIKIHEVLNDLHKPPFPYSEIEIWGKAARWTQLIIRD